MTNRGLFKGTGTQALRLDNKKIQNVATPTVPKDVANKQYVDALPDPIQPSFSATGPLTIGVGTFRFYNDSGRSLTFVSIRASVGTAPTGAAIILDININGTTIFTTQANRPTIAAASNTVKTANPDVTSIADGSYITVDIDQVGSTVAGSDLTVIINMT